VRCLDFEIKAKDKEKELKAQVDTCKGRVTVEIELMDLKKYVVAKRINGFNKALQKAEFFYSEVLVKDT